MAEEIKYIPYGTDLIDYNQFLLNSANEVQNYINQLPWSRKRKESFLNAYKQLMALGITGASNDNGIWRINYNGEQIDLDSKSKIDREMFGEAAYFIQLQMSGLKPKLKELEENKNKSIFDNLYFTSSFHNQINKDLYGGRGLYTSEWNKQDARGENGLLNIDNRADLLAKQLRKYADSLKEEDLDFKDSPFENLADFKTRIESAITALNSKNPDAIRESLNRLGLNYDNYFYNGSEDAFKTDGYEGTYGDYYGNYLPKLLKEKQQAEETKLKTAWNNGYKYMKFYGQGLFGKPLSPEKSSLDYLNQLAAKDNLNGDEQSELVGAFKLAAKNGALLDLSKEELAKFGPFGSEYTSRPGRLKKINGLNGLYWDTLGNKVIKPFVDKSNATSNFLNILDLNNPQIKLNLLKEQLIKQMNLPIQGSLDLSDLSNFGFDEATGNELWAVLNDIGAFVDPEAITGTAMALNAARLRDKNREGWSWERLLDWGTSSLGGLPIIGDAASVIKAGSNLVKLANKSARVGSFIGMAFSAVNMPEAWDSIKKIYDKGITSMTPLDILNITYGLMGLFAGIKTINSINARSKPQTTTENSIEIDGKKVKLPDQATADKVNAEYKTAKNNTEASLKVVKMQEVREAAKKAGVEITDASKVTSGSGFLRGNLISRKVGFTKSPIKSKLVNTGKLTEGSAGGYYMNPLRRSFLNLEQKEIKNPLRKTFDWFLGRTSEPKSIETPKSNTSIKEPTTKSAETSKSNTEKSSTEKPRKSITKENISKMKEKISRKKDLRDLLNFRKTNPKSNTSLEIKPGEIKIGNKVFRVKETDIASKNKKEIDNIRRNFKNQIELYLNSSKSSKEKVKKIREKLIEAKKLGWWKLGGVIEPSTDTIIENFLNNNNK